MYISPEPVFQNMGKEMSGTDSSNGGEYCKNPAIGG